MSRWVRNLGLFMAALIIGLGLGMGATFLTQGESQIMASPVEQLNDQITKNRPALLDRPILTVSAPNTEDGRLSMARPTTDIRANPRIVIIIDDLGHSAHQSAKIAALPGPLTLSFLPYPVGVKEQALQAQKEGHSIFLHLPMEPGTGRADEHKMVQSPGPNALMSGMEREEINRLLALNLSKLPQIDGVNNHMGSKFTRDRASLNVLMKGLSRRGLYFVDSLTDGRSAAAKIAAQAGMPALTRDIFLDADHGAGGVASVQAQLRLLEEIAREHGQAIAIAHPYDSTIEALGPWLVTAPARGFEIVTVPELVRGNEAMMAEARHHQ